MAAAALFGGGGGGGGNATADFYTPKFSGGGGGGGGGGTSGVPGGAVGVSSYAIQPTAAGAGPAVTISWTEPAPTVSTAAPTTVTASTAALAGSVNPNGYPITDCHFVISPAPATGATVPCAQQVGGGTDTLAVTAAAVGLAPRTSYTATLVAASSPGVASGPTVAFTTIAAGQTSTGATGAPTAAARQRSEAQPGALSHRHTPGTGGPAHQRRHHDPVPAVRAGSREAHVRASPRRPDSRAPLPSPARAPKRGRRCTRYLGVVGAVQHTAHAGANRIRFEGVLDNGRRLTPGAYRLSLTAIDTSGAASPTQHAHFTVIK